jgi:hypothetical protein
MGEGIKLFFSSLPGGSGFFDDHVNWPDRDAFIEEHYESETDDGQPRLVTSDGGVVQNVAPRNLEALHRRLRQTVLIRTHKDDLVGLPGKRFERIDVPLTDGADRDWFDAKARSALVVSRALRRAQREHNLERARQLEQKSRQLRSAITQHATRCKRQAVLDYLLAFPPEHKVDGGEAHCVRRDTLDLRRPRPGH